MGNATSKDGALTKICESIPIVGTATAGIHALAGNGDHAKRALAVSTGSLIKAGGAIGGFCVGGPLGAVAGGAAAASLGIGAEYGISKTIDDPNVKGDVGSVSLKRIAIETVIGGGTAMIGGGGAAAVKEAGTQIAKSTASQVAKGLLKEAAEEAGKELLRHGTQTTLTQIATKAAVQTTVQAAQQLQKIRPTFESVPKSGEEVPQKKKRLVVTLEQDAAARDLDAVIDSAISAYVAGDREPHRVFTRKVVVRVPLANEESIVSMLRVLKTSVTSIIHGWDFANADEAYQGGSRFAIDTLNRKWSKMLEDQYPDLEDAGLWQNQQNRVEQANNDVATAMSTGGELVDF
ncbi:hypothetical protein N0V87_005286 [Didymella glomerata]|uniref:Uncharacterized protein n=1 Tax=Didymella glomerata TaxID=749621 RepID=A0A9W8WYS0_9PLEO|nr:hypothetical protein N0V87_005286 [Didymella glomerata]